MSIQVLEWKTDKPEAPGWYWYRSAAPTRSEDGSYYRVTGALYFVTIELNDGDGTGDKLVAVRQSSNAPCQPSVYVKHMPGEWASFEGLMIPAAAIVVDIEKARQLGMTSVNIPCDCGNDRIKGIVIHTTWCNLYVR